MFSSFFVNIFSATNYSIGDISNWNVSKVENMDSMFSGYGKNSSSELTLDLSGWDTSKVTNMEAMFSGTSKLKTIYVSDKWNTNAVTSSESMFYGCTSLVGGAGTAYSSSNPKDKTYARIDGGTSSPGYLTSKA